MYWCSFRIRFCHAVYVPDSHKDLDVNETFIKVTKVLWEGRRAGGQDDDDIAGDVR